VARFLAALSALIRLCSGVGGLMISVIRIKYLACQEFELDQQTLYLSAIGSEYLNRY
jgi:hypothetical protein